MQSAARFSAVLMQKTYSKWNASSGYHQTYFCHVSLFAIVAPPLLCPFWGLHDVCIRAFVYCALRLSLLAWLAYHFAAWSLYVPPAVGGVIVQYFTFASVIAWRGIGCSDGLRNFFNFLLALPANARLWRAGLRRYKIISSAGCMAWVAICFNDRPDSITEWSDSGRVTFLQGRGQE